MGGIESMYDDMPRKRKNALFKRMLYWDAIASDNFIKNKKPPLWDLDRPWASLREIFGSRILSALGI